MIVRYQMTLKRNLNLSFLIRVYLSLALAIAAFVFFYHSHAGFAKLIKGLLIVLSITSSMSIAGIILHLMYYFNDKGKRIHFAKEGIEVTRYNLTKNISYTDISKIEEKKSQYTYGVPWRNYGFIKVIMKDNTVERITCLLIDPSLVATELSQRCDSQVEVFVLGVPYLFF